MGIHAYKINAEPIGSDIVGPKNTHSECCRRAGGNAGCKKGGTRLADELLGSEARDGHELSGHVFAT